ncbi:hypothetical protein EDD15DRAFT_2444317 [Pisolithus albus]|nr:hypothetical protein EDD15DRAFT_2444317 [Pisolithus albus]
MQERTIIPIAHGNIEKAMMVLITFILMLPLMGMISVDIFHDTAFIHQLNTKHKTHGDLPVSLAMWSRGGVRESSLQMRTCTGWWEIFLAGETENTQADYVKIGSGQEICLAGKAEYGQAGHVDGKPPVTLHAFLSATPAGAGEKMGEVVKMVAETKTTTDRHHPEKEVREKAERLVVCVDHKQDIKHLWVSIPKNIQLGVLKGYKGLEVVPIQSLEDRAQPEAWGSGPAFEGSGPGETPGWALSPNKPYVRAQPGSKPGPDSLSPSLAVSEKKLKIDLQGYRGSVKDVRGAMEKKELK